ncbi:immunoglobulin-like domain-containing protein [Bifidobacterium goeldii]|uniref:immunoglobulin-like domain-containing protein n=1 Tax=Bifidobacterium goeldii TaxID=2306975 RepID=UPI0013DD98A8
MGKIIGLLCALAMLLTGALVASPAYAADESNGDVQLDWNWGGHTPEGKDAHPVIKGTRNGDDWTPELKKTDENTFTPNGGKVNNTSRYFFGWNSKADGTGDWYDFVRNDTTAGYSTVGMPKTADGAVKFPAGGKLYAQWMDSLSSFPVTQDYTANSVDEVKSLKLRAYAAISQFEPDVDSSWFFSGDLYVRACMESCQSFTNFPLIPVRYSKSGMETFTLASKAAGNEQAFDKFLTKAFADKSVTSLQIGTDSNSNIAIIALHKPADTKVNVPQSPKFGTRGPSLSGNSTEIIQLGSQYDPRPDGLTAIDAQGNDISSRITVSSNNVDTSKLGRYTVEYRVVDDQGYVATARKNIRVIMPTVSADKLTEDNHVKGLIKEVKAQKSGSGYVYYSFVLNLGVAYANTQVAVYPFASRDFLHPGQYEYRESQTHSADKDGIVTNAGGYGDSVYQVGENRIMVIPMSDPSKIMWDSFTVTDVKAPVISGADDTSVDLNASFDPKAGVTASDETDGDLTKSMTIDGTVDTSKAGLYEVNYVVSDKIGHRTRWSRVINVVPTTDNEFTQNTKNPQMTPSATIRQGDKMIASVGKEHAGESVGAYAQKKTQSQQARTSASRTRARVLAAADTTSRITLTNKTTVSDDGTITVTVPKDMPVGDYYLVVTYPGGMMWNDLTVTPAETTTPTDTTKPVFKGISDVTIEQGATFDPLSGVTASDDTDGDLTKSIKVEGTVDTSKPGTATLTYTVSDKAGNTATATRTVTVKAKDTTGPTDPSGPSEPSQPSQPSQPSTPTAGAVPVYRLYNYNSGLHHYTTSAFERDDLVHRGWRDEGTSFKAAAKDDKNTNLQPVYREYNPNDGNHNWTTDKNEHDDLIQRGWRDEGIAWYTDTTATVTVYRLYNPNSGEHVYTTSKYEYDQVGAAGWRQEGTAWMGLK